MFKAIRTRDNLPVACKRLQMLDSARRANISAKNELFVMERVDHPHIIKMYQHFIVDFAGTRFVYIFMQLAEGDSLSVYMRAKVKFGLPEPVCKRMMAEMVTAVNHMHSKGIAHRDLKMGNILLDQNTTCLVSDFGLSRVAFRPSKGEKILWHTFLHEPGDSAL